MATSSAPLLGYIQHIGNQIEVNCEKDSSWTVAATLLVLAALATTSSAEARWGGWGGWGWGVGAFAAGAVIGSALTAPYYGYAYAFPVTPMLPATVTPPHTRIDMLLLTRTATLLLTMRLLIPTATRQGITGIGRRSAQVGEPGPKGRGFSYGCRRGQEAAVWF